MPLWATAAGLLLMAVPEVTPPAALFQDPIVWRFFPRSELAVGQLSARVPELLARLRAELGLKLHQTIEVWIVPGQTGPEIEAPRWAAAYAEPGRRRIIVRQIDAQRALALLQHELVHLAVHQAVRTPIPRWFDEGLALVYGGEWGMAESLRAAAASWNRDWLPLDRVEDRLQGSDAERAQQAYLESAAFLLHLRSAYGADAPRRIVAAMAAGQSFAEAFEAVTGVEVKTVERVFLGAPKPDWLAAFSRLLGGQSMLYAAIAVLALVAAAVFLVRQRRRRTLMELEEWSSDQTIH
jgi:hypothetical protein